MVVGLILIFVNFGTLQPSGTEPLLKSETAFTLYSARLAKYFILLYMYIHIVK